MLLQLKNLRETRLRARLIVGRCVARCIWFRTYRAFGVWVLSTIVHIQAALLTRLVRGWLGRLKVRNIHWVHYSAILVQSNVRRYLVVRKLQRFSQWQAWGAAEIQRRVRGHLARKTALSLLGYQVTDAKRGVSREREAWRKDSFAVVVQTWWRQTTARSSSKSSVARVAQEQTVQMVERELSMLERIDQAGYKQAMEKWLADYKRRVEQEEITRAFLDREKHKIWTRRRFKKRELDAAKRLEVERTAEKLEEVRVEHWLETWATVEEGRKKDLEVRLRAALHNPITVKEQSLRKELVLEARKLHAKAVVQEVEVLGGYKIELNQVEEIALERVIQHRLMSVALDVRNEMASAAANYEVGQAKERKVICLCCSRLRVVCALTS